ncbi:hypothetical protein RB595_005462 [Gaeumannomyces hyphopodioides]
MKKTKPLPPVHMRRLFEVRLSRDRDEPHVDFTLRHNISRSGITWELLLWKQGDRRVGTGRLLDHEWIDLDLLRSWKHECLASHGDECSNPFGIPQVLPAWLVDTAEKRLVPGTAAGTPAAAPPGFVALSYMWGSEAAAAFRTEMRTVRDLQRPGALSDLPLSATIRHAMGLVGALGERYLWVDALCVVQDDEIHGAEQLRLMGGIYASAKLTIVAADHDASVGIPGLRHISEPRVFEQRSRPAFGGGAQYAIVRSQPLEEMVDGCAPYFKRGWTYQEFLLSQRKLLFNGSQAYWRCSRARWSEGVVGHFPGSSRSKIAENAFARLLLGHPNIGWLDWILRESRNLTYPEDALPGILGLLSLLWRPFPGGFLYGLPEVNFEAALMWHPGFVRFAKPRRSSGNFKTPLFGLTSALPTWSWLSLQGFGMNPVPGETYTGWIRGYQAAPITQWYTHSTPCHEDRRPIRPEWHTVTERAGAEDVWRSEGWAREEFDAAKHMQDGSKEDDKRHKVPPEGLGRYIYKHPDLPGKEYWAPLPLGSKEPSQLSGPPQTPYISCETKKGWFAVERVPEAGSTDEQILVDGYRVGSLIFQHESDKELFPMAGDEDAEEVGIELVAVCRTRVPLTKSLEGTDDAAQPAVTYSEYYGVLWVEWRGGVVAYRRGSAHVLKDWWEKHDLEDVHLILG